MRRVVMFCFVMLSICTSSFAQEEYSTEYEVRYDVEFSLDSLNLDKKQKETVYLFTGKSYGVFLNHNQANVKAIIETMERMEKLGNYDREKSSYRDSDFKESIYKNFSEERVVVRLPIVEDLFVYTEPNVPFIWEMHEDSKEVMGYTVQKATTSFAGRDYEAWFTMEIPIPDGPYVFYGLPGLIVELYDTENHYHFTLQSLSKLEEEKVWRKPRGKSIDKTMRAELLSKELDATIARAMKFFDSGNFSMEVNGQEIGASQYRRMLIEEAKKKNNRIERE